MRKMLQEEVVPAYGSIYPRTLTPGPGYYGVPDMLAAKDAATFGARRKGCIDVAVDQRRLVPDPGAYDPKPETGQGTKLLGNFNKAYLSTLMNPAQTMKKLPYLSTEHSLSEAPSVHSPAAPFYSVAPEALASARASAPGHRFGKLRRPF